MASSSKHRVARLMKHACAAGVQASKSLKEAAGRTEMKGKRAVVTGAASGIGRATAMLMAARGASVLLTDVSSCKDQLREAVKGIKEAGGIADWRVCDVSKDSDIQAAIEHCCDVFGGIDVMIANAGVVDVSPFEDLDGEDFERVLGVNTVGCFLCMKHAAIKMQAQGTGGSIAATASVAGLKSSAGGIAYSASKAAVVSMAQTLAWQLFGTGVRVNAVCPGLIETGMTAPFVDMARQRGRGDKLGQLNPCARIGQADEIAQAFAFLASDAASYVNGQAVVVDGGLSASLPVTRPGKRPF